MTAPRAAKRRECLHRCGYLAGAVLALFLLWNMRAAIFATPYYETGDVAANSLSVRDAGVFRELYGPYSRWGFHHPGPALFYFYAAAEALFHRALGWVPAPGDAQWLATVLLQSALLGWSLAALGALLGARAFLPLALCAAAAHFPPAGDWVFVSTWSAHVLVVPFLALLAASTCIAAGDGRQLPLLVIAGGLLVHLHVAQPTFVVPLAVGSYAALLRRVRRAEGVWPWRRFPRAHAIAAVLLALFLLPILLDASRGAESNISKILEHQRVNGGFHKPLRSFAYLLNFGTYLYWVPGARVYAHDAAAALHFIRVYSPVHLAWLLTWLVPLAWIVRQRRRVRAGTILDGARTRAVQVLASANGVFLAAVALTLLWGATQAGELFYHNALFNYSIYYFSALLLIALAAVLFERRVGTRAAAVWLLVPVVFGFCARWLRGFDPGVADGLAVHERDTPVLISEAAPERPTILAFPAECWELGAALVLDAERRGVAVYVPAIWQTIFDRERTAAMLDNELIANGSVRRLKHLGLSGGDSLPLLQRCALETSTRMIDAHGGAIAFTRGQDWESVVMWGFMQEQSDFALTTERTAALRFHGGTAAGDVEIVAEVAPALDTPQRVRLLYNAHTLEEHVVARPESLVWRIPRALWNARPTSTIVLELPDAAPGLPRLRLQDWRRKSLEVRAIRFRAEGP
jgi:hypothetical protein